jgi:hypothetical protein
MDHDRWWLLHKSANFRTAMFHVINKHSVSLETFSPFLRARVPCLDKLTEKDTGGVSSFSSALDAHSLLREWSMRASS